MNNDNKTASIKSAAIIATCNRTELLLSRSLPSIAAQTLIPDYLIVCDDSDPDIRAHNRKALENLELPGCQVRYLENHRTPGASGAWNTAVYALYQQVTLREDIALAFLDDDDRWSPEYLRTCIGRIREGALDMVASGMLRIEGSSLQPTLQFAPDRLEARQFLAGNPGIQGSNLCLRMSVFLHAGGFDEALSSCTDRDLCIRLADLGTVRYGAVSGTLVEHFAERGRPRLSTYASEAKLQGLTRFWNKHAGRMDAVVRGEFERRAVELFGWQKPLSPSTSATAHPSDAAVVIGISPRLTEEDANHLASQLVEIGNERSRTLDIVLLDTQQYRHGSITRIAGLLRDNGVGCLVVTDRVRSEMRQAVLGLTDEQTCTFYSQLVSTARPGSKVLIITGRHDLTPATGDTPSLAGVRDAHDVHTHSQPLLPDGLKLVFNRWLAEQRAETAQHCIEQRHATGDLQLIGQGSEGVAFTDGRTVFKWIDYWKARLPEAQLAFLKSCMRKWSGQPGLYPLTSVCADAAGALLTYDYEKSTPYQGGHECRVLQLLDSCCRAGIVCNNVHPKNLIVTSSEVKLIDYGSDIRPWTPLGFEQMVRRAYLSVHHATRPDLAQLMRTALTNTSFPEMNNYSAFRKKLDFPFYQVPEWSRLAAAPGHAPISLIVGIITSEPDTVLSLLRSLAHLHGSPGVSQVRVLILDNQSPAGGLESVLGLLPAGALTVEVICRTRYERDAEAGLFGQCMTVAPSKHLSIAASRTILQRYLGLAMREQPGSIGWLLDDDMRVDARALKYLPWLCAFRAAGVDVVFGAYEQSSPNPPLNGLRVQLMDLVHNLLWLQSLDQQIALPDRRKENDSVRERFPDYYYDLSRKHSAHLEQPVWLEPAYEYETVAEARARLIHCAQGILDGSPVTRAIVADEPENPLADAHDSVNRGGCTFILNPDAVNLTPNLAIRLGHLDTRRSDMLWAIINKHYRGMSLKAAGFPIQHINRVQNGTAIDSDKVVSEIVGSAVYAGLTEYLKKHPHHRLRFSASQAGEAAGLIVENLAHRVAMLDISYRRMLGLSLTLDYLDEANELAGIRRRIKQHITPETINKIRAAASKITSGQVSIFLTDIAQSVDNYAAAYWRIDQTIKQSHLNELNTR